jgi:hypothetical protein
MPKVEKHHRHYIRMEAAPPPARGLHSSGHGGTSIFAIGCRIRGKLIKTNDHEEQDDDEK